MKTQGLHNQLVEWRHDLHMHPQISFEEEFASNKVANLLKDFGIEVHQGIAKTGVVGVLKKGTSNKSIGIRADMDALPINEINTFSYKSTIENRMHACGHDGHTAMLLGAAKLLASRNNFNGTVYFIFQPAEEGGGGGLAMIDDGLFDEFPMDSVWGMHNWPGMEEGTVAVHKGSVMAAADRFEVTVNGNGGHAAMPQATNDPVLAVTAIIQALQQIVARKQNPLDAVVVSVTQINAGSGFNIIPQKANFIGTIRTVNPATRVDVHKQFTQICEATALAYGCVADVSVIKGYPVTVNDIESSDKAIEVASSLFGKNSVKTNLTPSMGAEDFAYMLEKTPGAYIWLGAGEGKSGCMLHNTKYDFNDNILPLGISYWEKLVKTELPLR